MTEHASSNRAAKRWNTYDDGGSSLNCCPVDNPCSRHAIPNRPEPVRLTPEAEKRLAQADADLAAGRTIPGETTPNRVAAFAAIEDALRLALHALESHDQWCGHNPDAPGDSSYNRAIEAIQAILDTEASGYA